MPLYKALFAPLFEYCKLIESIDTFRHSDFGIVAFCFGRQEPAIAVGKAQQPVFSFSSRMAAGMPRSVGPVWIVPDDA